MNITSQPHYYIFEVRARRHLAIKLARELLYRLNDKVIVKINSYNNSGYVVLLSNGILNTSSNTWKKLNDCSIAQITIIYNEVVIDLYLNILAITIVQQFESHPKGNLMARWIIKKYEEYKRYNGKKTQHYI